MNWTKKTIENYSISILHLDFILIIAKKENMKAIILNILQILEKRQQEKLDNSLSI